MNVKFISIQLHLRTAATAVKLKNNNKLLNNLTLKRKTGVIKKC